MAKNAHVVKSIDTIIWHLAAGVAIPAQPKMLPMKQVSLRPIKVLPSPGAPIAMQLLTLAAGETGAGLIPDSDVGAAVHKICGHRHRLLC